MYPHRYALRWNVLHPFTERNICVLSDFVLFMNVHLLFYRSSPSHGWNLQPQDLVSVSNWKSTNNDMHFSVLAWASVHMIRSIYHDACKPSAEASVRWAKTTETVLIVKIWKWLILLKSYPSGRQRLASAGSLWRWNDRHMCCKI